MPILAVGGKAIKAGEIASYCNDTFYDAMEKWTLTKMWGMPHGGGWAEEPIDFINAITTLESENNKIEAEELDKKTKSTNVAEMDKGELRKA